LKSISDESESSPSRSPHSSSKPSYTGPYTRVVECLSKLTYAINPVEKLQCISNASNFILACVDEFYSDKTQNILMGAEDKFPVLIYALIRANITDLWSHCCMIQDFVSEHLGDEESKYRASEFNDAIKYIQSLDWNLRDKQDILIPLKMIISSVAWTAKAVDRLKFSDRVDTEADKFDILIALSDIFRAISQRRSDIYSPYKIPSKLGKLILKFETFFTACLETKDLGLKIRKENGANGIHIYLEFELRHPVYVYQKLSETCVVLEAE